MLTNREILRGLKRLRRRGVAVSVKIYKNSYGNPHIRYTLPNTAGSCPIHSFIGILEKFEDSLMFDLTQKKYLVK